MYIIYGTGKVAQRYIVETGRTPDAYCETNPKKDWIGAIPVLAPYQLDKYHDQVVIALAYWQAIKSKLKNIGFDDSMIRVAFQQDTFGVPVGRYTQFHDGLLYKDVPIQSIGAFCSIAEGVRVVANHDLDFVTTRGAANDSRWGFLKADRPLPVKKAVIWNDVWIGHRAVIIAGSHICNGAVVGAGSVVTHSVLPYTIVAGNPAREIGRRKVVVDGWWEKSDAEITELFEQYAAPQGGKEKDL